MAVRHLRERARARDQVAVDDGNEWPQRKVLSERQRERESPLIDIEASPRCVECDPEERTVGDVHREAERTPAATEEQDVRVVAAEHAPVERLLQSPDESGDGAGRCGTDTRRHTLPACPKATLFTALRAASRSSWGRSSRWRRRTRAPR